MKARYLRVSEYGVDNAVEGLVHRMENYSDRKLKYPPVITVDEVSPDQGMSSASTVLIFDED